MFGGLGLTEKEIEDMLHRYAKLYIQYYVEGEEGDAMCYQVRNNIVHHFEKTGLDGKAVVILANLEDEIGLTINEIRRCIESKEYQEKFGNALAEKLLALS